MSEGETWWRYMCTTRSWVLKIIFKSNAKKLEMTAYLSHQGLKKRKKKKHHYYGHAVKPKWLKIHTSNVCVTYGVQKNTGKTEPWFRNRCYRKVSTDEEMNRVHHFSYFTRVCTYQSIKSREYTKPVDQGRSPVLYGDAKFLEIWPYITTGICCRCCSLFLV